MANQMYDTSSPLRPVSVRINMTRATLLLVGRFPSHEKNQPSKASDRSVRPTRFETTPTAVDEGVRRSTGGRGEPRFYP
jgi:hypothetical protein